MEYGVYEDYVQSYQNYENDTAATDVCNKDSDPYAAYVAACDATYSASYKHYIESKLT